MSSENVDVVRRMYEAYIAGDAEGALACCHPDVVVDFSVRADTGVGAGREALRETVGAWVETWEGYSERIDEIRDLGDVVYVAATQSGRGRGSGLEIENRFAGLFEVADGQVTKIKMYETPERAREAAGLPD